MRDLFVEFLSHSAVQNDNIRLRHAIAARHHGFFANHHFYDDEVMRKSAMYTEFLFPNGLGYAAGSMLPMPNGDLAIFDLERRYVDGPVTSQELARLDALRPHLARAAALSARLSLERSKAVVTALVRAGMPAAVMGPDGRVLAANALFEAMSEQIMFLAFGKLALANPSSNLLLRAALSESAPDHTRSIPLPATEESAAAVLHTIPLSRDAADAADTFSSASTLLIVTHLDRPTAPSAELLGGLFDLTPSEARVARGVMEGGSTEEIASDLGLARETVRFYLKGVFAKVGVNRQIDLLALLSGAQLPAKN
jgi:DNA-binding CsgD family transcriptional regulator